MRFAIILSLACFGVSLLQAEVSTPAHQSTTAPISGRYEIVQSPLAAKWTFKLDKYSGRIWQLVRTPDDENAWEEMAVKRRPTIKTFTKARIQIFTSGLAARHTFLLDSETGKTWVLASGKSYDEDGSETETIAWEPFSD
jgi:hypothetical protein